MNIQQAKKQIVNAIGAYLTKDEFGNYEIPIESQRPIFLLGAPGIGKTAIMEQIAQELDVGLVAYSMTHHTRQSALGLPFITTRNYGGVDYQISEYTMSEIISTVYDTIERTGKKEGILFLDEINCVSETLTPAILQFLQYKIFGRHRIPEGWIVVTAGNPAEYNRSIREFDIATWDRLKRIDVEPDFDVWKEYAYAKGVHPAVLTYLEIERDDFYKVETTVDGKAFVTARGWDDLSQMIRLYEQNSIKVDSLLIGQYLQSPQIAKRFSVYYDLFNKYRSDYQVDAILAGNATEDIYERAQAAGFDERISLLGLIIDALGKQVRSTMMKEKTTAFLHDRLAALKETSEHSTELRPVCTEQSESIQELLDTSRLSGTLSDERYFVYSSSMAFFEDLAQAAQPVSFDDIRTAFDGRIDELDESIAASSGALDNALKFIEDCYGEEQEMLLAITDLSVNPYTMPFINEHGCERYFAHNRGLLFFERGKDLSARIEELDLDDNSAEQSDDKPE